MQRSITPDFLAWLDNTNFCKQFQITLWGTNEEPMRSVRNQFRGQRKSLIVHLNSRAVRRIKLYTKVCYVKGVLLFAQCKYLWEKKMSSPGNRDWGDGGSTLERLVVTLLEDLSDINKVAALQLMTVEAIVSPTENRITYPVRRFTNYV